MLSSLYRVSRTPEVASLDDFFSRPSAATAAAEKPVCCAAAADAAPVERVYREVRLTEISPCAAAVTFRLSGVWDCDARAPRAGYRERISFSARGLLPSDAPDGMIMG